MKYKSTYLPVFMITCFAIAGCSNNATTDAVPNYKVQVDTIRNPIEEIPGEYIVLLDSVKGSSIRDRIESIQNLEALLPQNREFTKALNESFKQLKIKPDSLVSVNNNLLVLKLLQPQVQVLNQDKRIRRIEKNYLIRTDQKSAFAFAFTGQQVPWGIRRSSNSIKPNLAYRGKVWIIDTGIDKDQPDLTIDQENSTSFFPGKKYYDVTGEGNDHGTHVAGIISAKNNEFGVVGIAPGAVTVAVKIIDNRVFKNDYYLRALSYVNEKAVSGDVLNLSLQNTPGTQTEVELILGIADKGVKVVISAGNYKLDVNTFADNIGVYPARIDHPNVFTVSSYNINGSYSLFSNFGNSVDYSAPGEGVLSTLPQNQYGYMDGTSMAAPHLSGLLLLNQIVHTAGTVQNDPDGKTDPIVHE